jgi:hypothetical protein
MAGSGIRSIQSLIRESLIRESRIRRSRICTAALIILALSALACGISGSPVEAAARLGLDPRGVVDIGTAAIAPSLGPDGSVSIIAVHQRDGEWLSNPITTSPGQAGTDSLHLLTYGGATEEDWNTFVFGTAAPGTARVELSGFADHRGGIVVGGAWIIALREMDLSPQDMHWRFVNEDGSSRSGTGIFPPDA